MKRSINLTQLFIFTLFFGLLTVVSCKKETSGTAVSDPEEENASKVSSQADEEAEGIFNASFDDAMGASNDVGVEGSGIFFSRSDTLIQVPRCFTVTTTHPGAAFFPVVVVIDFGTTGCTGPDGHVRKGKIRIEYSNRLVLPGAIATTTFDGFYIDDIHVEGIHKITNTGTLVPLSRKYKVEVTGGKLTKTNGDYTEWNSTKTITQIEGLGTPDFARDDIFKIEGSARGQSRRGTLVVAWESNITEPLIRRVTCRWIVYGRIRTVRLNTSASGPWVSVLDFGNRNCDDQATLTINGRTIQITLP